MQNFLPLPDGRALVAGPGQRAHHGVRALASPRATPNACPPTTRCSMPRSTLLRSQLLETPPADPRRLRDLWGALQMGRQFRKLDASVQRDIHELFTRSAGDLLDHWFESDAVKALYGFDAVVGSYASPYTPGSAYVLLHHVFGEVNGKAGVWGHAVGGMGAITPGDGRRGAPARRAPRNRRARETHRRREAARATGIELEDGRVIQGSAVAANVGPKLLYLKLLARSRRAGGIPRAHRAAARRFGHLPHERRAVRAAEIHRRAARRRRRASRLRNHSRAFARIHGPRVRRCAPRRNVAQTRSWRC